MQLLNCLRLSRDLNPIENSWQHDRMLAQCPVSFSSYESEIFQKNGYFNSTVRRRFTLAKAVRIANITGM